MDIQSSMNLWQCFAFLTIQGVVLGGLMNLYLITGNETLLEVANNIANATTHLLIYPNGLNSVLN